MIEALTILIYLLMIPVALGIVLALSLGVMVIRETNRRFMKQKKADEPDKYEVYTN